MAREILTLKRKKSEPEPEKVEIKPAKPEPIPEPPPVKKEFSKIPIDDLYAKRRASYSSGYKNRVKKLAAEQYNFFKDDAFLDDKTKAQLDCLSRAFSERIYFKMCSLGILEFFE